jgi:hypothetical protein
MGDFDIANQRMAQVSRTLKLLNFKFMQLRHTERSIARRPARFKILIRQMSPTSGSDAALPSVEKDRPS